MTNIPDQGSVARAPQAEGVGRASTPESTDRPGVFVVLNIDDFPVEVAVSRGRALELERAGAGRALTWVPFDVHLGRGETDVTPPQGFTDAYAHIALKVLREANAVQAHQEAMAEVKQLRARLLDATPHDHSAQTGPGRPVNGCPRCALELEFTRGGDV